MEEKKLRKPLPPIPSSIPSRKKIASPVSKPLTDNKTIETLSTTIALDTKIAPETKGVRYPALQKSLQDAYRHCDQLPLPISGQDFPIQEVSLTLSEKSLQEIRTQQRLKESKESKGGKESKTRSEADEIKGGNRIEEDRSLIEKPIAVKELFCEGESKTTKQRILVEGRAGMGKTTLSQYLAWQWSTQGLYSGDYDYVLWVPLRHWLQAEIDPQISFAEDLAQFILNHHAPKIPSEEVRLDELEVILTPGQDKRTLLVLDGYDEVAHLDPKSPAKKLLETALRFPQVVVTTRDYQHPPVDIRFDRELVNMGFSDTQVGTYIRIFNEQFAEPISSSTQVTLEHKGQGSQLSAAQLLETTLKKNPRLWSLAQIPLNLALICEIMQSNSTTIQDISMAGLYQQITQHFLKRHVSRYGRTLPKIHDAETVKRLCPLELDGLQHLAWQGFVAHQPVLLPDIQKKALQSLREHYPKAPEGAVEEGFQQVFDMGFLRYEGGRKPRDNSLEQAHYFIHLTFQEYFAADYLRQALQGSYGKAEYERCLNWITEHKYQPHCSVVFGFLAELTIQPGYDQALQAFWSALLSPPYDITGVAHQQLVVRCLEEARCDRRIPYKDKLLNELQLWAEKILRSKNSEKYQWFLYLLAQNPHVIQQSAVLETLLNALKDKEKNIRKRAADSLGGLGAAAATSAVLAALIVIALNDENRNVQSCAAKALGRMGSAVTPEILATLVGTLKDKRKFLPHRAIDVFDQLGMAAATPAVLDALLVLALKDKDEKVRFFAVQALGKLGTAAATPAVLASLLVALKDEGLQWLAAEALGNLGAAAATPEVLAALVALKDENDIIKPIAAAALGKLGATTATATPKVLTALVVALKATDEYVRSQAAGALGHLGTTPTPEVLTALVVALKDKEEDVRRNAAEALGNLGTTAATPEVLAALVAALKDKEEYVRGYAAEALGKLGTTAAPPEVLAALVAALKDKEEYVRGYAANALGQLGAAAATPVVLAALLLDLKDKEDNVQSNAAKALSQLGASAATPAVLAHLVLDLKDKEENVRRYAAEVLGKLGKTAATPMVLDALVAALKDKGGTQTEAANALNSLLTPTTLTLCTDHVLKLINDEGWGVNLENIPLPILIEHYLSWEMQQKRNLFTSTNPWQPFIIRRIEKEQAGIIIHGDTVQIITSNCESIPLKNPILLQPLFAALQKKHDKELPLPAWDAYIGKTTLYPDVHKPSFITSLTSPPNFTFYTGKVAPRTEEKIIASTLRRPRAKPVMSSILPTEQALHDEVTYLKQQKQFDIFLVNIKKSIRRMAKLYLQQIPESEHHALIEPKVFISYAWEGTGTDKLKHLQKTFLRDSLVKNLRAAGLNPWLDDEKMTGDMGGQMRDNIKDSQFVLLIGTNRYAERTKPPIPPDNTKTNVRLEFEFAMEQAQKSNDFLLPLLFEGEWGSTFPEISKKYLVRDGRKWFSFERGQWQSFKDYIKGFTQLSSPLGILPCLLGLNRSDYPQYRKECRELYETHQRNLMFELDKLETSQPVSPKAASLSASSSHEIKGNSASSLVSSASQSSSSTAFSTTVPPASSTRTQPTVSLTTTADNTRFTPNQPQPSFIPDLKKHRPPSTTFPSTTSFLAPAKVTNDSKKITPPVPPVTATQTTPTVVVQPNSSSLGMVFTMTSATLGQSSTSAYVLPSQPSSVTSARSNFFSTLKTVVDNNKIPPVKNKSWLQPSNWLRPGQVLIGLALPKTSGGEARLYVETVNKLGRQRCTAYHLENNHGEFDYTTHTITKAEDLTALGTTHSISAQIVDEEHSTALQTALMQQKNKPLATGSQVNWQDWYEQLEDSLSSTSQAEMTSF